MKNYTKLHKEKAKIKEMSENKKGVFFISYPGNHVVNLKINLMTPIETT